MSKIRAAPLGLLGFASTTIVLSLHNAGFGLPYGSPNSVVIGLAVFYGGLAQLLAGMWEFVYGTTFTGCVFTSYGAFWLSWSAISIPFFGVQAGFSKNQNATSAVSIGMFLMSWTIVTFIFLIATFRTNLITVAVFSFLFITFILLTIGDWTVTKGVVRAGGTMGIITAILAYYDAFTQLVPLNIGFVKKLSAPLVKPKNLDDLSPE
ncbi:hypothetical protein BB560_000643 [Smittium megazygosporum]|uniref:Uncharacterized protein n=1 Tax=Smittium megazygosporum TaxID=133381 RepID=A0A2T9ZJT1_9FUNG|nr:hypothetical protein BB560_000643 [Smittium megazygosporum]